MSERFAIELYLDPASENQVLKAWNVLPRRQITTHLIEMESCPHITLFSTPFLETSKIQSLLRTFASKLDPLSLSLSSVGAFPHHGDNLLFLVPTPSPSLLQFRSHLCDAIRNEGIEISDDFAFNSWIPYCSVAHHVPKNIMPWAFSLLPELKLPLSGNATYIALVQFSPVRGLFAFVLDCNVYS